MVKAKVRIDESKCNLCNLCLKFCPTGVFKYENRGIKVNNELCIACYGCVKLCPTTAISVEVAGYIVIDYAKYY
ncbi:MAG: 4Fe-4S binding protein [Ignisphaera sp.]|uniref:4Fe-4S dicluster domain-containing protein n=1 Tax=Ignisphaera aggregans TaxID=334771 RepID=A0A7C4JJS3_9CREN